MKRIIFIFAAILVATSMACHQGGQRKGLAHLHGREHGRHAPGHHTGHRLMRLHDAPMAQATHSPKGESGNQGHFRPDRTSGRVCQDHLRLQ